MQFLLTSARAIDRLNAAFGRIAAWLVLIACLISAGNAVSRYAFDLSSNAWLELQWYLFFAMVLFGAPHVLNVNEHVRVDIFYGRVQPRTGLTPYARTGNWPILCFAFLTLIAFGIAGLRVRHDA